MKTLEEARIQIDIIDREMARLFEERMQVVEDVVAYKMANNLQVLDSSREKQVIDKNKAYIQHAEFEPFYVEFITYLMSLSRKHQHQLSSKEVIGFQGTEGAFSHIALNRLFKDQQVKSYKTFEEVVLAVLNDEVEKAVLPFENSYTGEVGEVLDLLYKYDVMISDIYDLKIDQNLLAVKGADIKDIKQVYSHEQALNQSKHFLSMYPVELIPYPNTALAAKFVSETNDKSKAAVASLETAELYNLDVLVKNINTSEDNTTRFIVISKKGSDEGNRMSFIFTTDHHAGSLAKVINAISEHGFNMENLKSRAIHNQPWKYYFYVALEGSRQSDEAFALFEDFSRYCQDFRYLGSYTKQEN